MEIARLREQIREMVDELPPVGHVAGGQNPADLGTRGEVSIGDLGPSSTWQVGPPFLQQEYESWPGGLDKDVVVKDIPNEECRMEATSAFQVGTSVPESPAKVLLQEVGQSSGLGKVVASLVEHALQREKLEMAAKVVARVLLAVMTGRRESCQETPRVRLMQLAIQMMLRLASKSAIQALKDGKLRGLGAQEKDGVVWVSGRIRGDKLAALLGTEALPVILPSETTSNKSHGEGAPRGPPKGSAGCSCPLQEDGLGDGCHSPCQVSHRLLLHLPTPRQAYGNAADGTTPERETRSGVPIRSYGLGPLRPVLGQGRGQGQKTFQVLGGSIRVHGSQGGGAVALPGVRD